jgi:TonB family protein
MAFGVSWNKSEIGKHLLSLAVSLVIHAGFLVILIFHFASVKIIDFKPQVTNVIIAPPPPGGLLLPRVGSMPNGLPPVESDFLDFLPQRVRPARPPAEIPSAGPLEAGPPVDEKFTRGFRLDRKSGEKPGQASGDRLRLPIPDRRAGPVGGVGGYVSPRRNVDLQRYLSSDSYVGLGSGLHGYAGGRSGKASLRGRASASSAVRNYDLSPWAKDVTAIIQNRWAITQIQSRSINQSVEIAVVILKTGEVSSAMIVEPSDDRSFDQSALEAIEGSSPLPALPGNFPATSLEISFVFTRQ